MFAGYDAVGCLKAEALKLKERAQELPSGDRIVGEGAVESSCPSGERHSGQSPAPHASSPGASAAHTTSEVGALPGRHADATGHPESPLRGSQRLIKRLFDLIAGTLVTALALPAMGMVALMIKLDSPGPVLLRQKRVGEGGRIFSMFKFRSMIAGAEDTQEEINLTEGQGSIFHKSRSDPRVTRTGRFIRRFNLDELPQLLNVIMGDMSLVGPRPELPWLVERYEPWQYRRLLVPQGMTGWWQVNGRSNKPMHVHPELDLYYIEHYSLLLDLKILWRTIGVVLSGDGAF